MQRKYPKPQIMIGVPTGGNPSAYFMQSVMGMAMPTNFSQTLRLVHGREVGEARCILAQEAINNQFEYLLFLDEDMIFPGNLVQKLLYHLQTKPDWSVVSGLYATKTVPPEPLVFTEAGRGPSYGWKFGEVIPVLFTGLGATMIRVKDMIGAFDDCPEYDERNPWSGALMRVRQRFFTGEERFFENGGVQKVGWTEDSYFYSHMLDAGRKVFVDTSLECGHYDKNKRVFYYPPKDNGTAVEPEPFSHDPCVVNLGAGGEYNPYEVLVDLRDEPGIFRADVRALPDDWEGKFDVAKSHHVLEHFGFEETDAVLQEWYRIIKPGGHLEIHVPDLQTIAEEIIKGRMDIWMMGAIYGDQGHPLWQQEPYGGIDERGRFLSHSHQHNQHKSGFTAQSLIDALHRAGFARCEAERDINRAEVRVIARKEKADDTESTGRTEEADDTQGTK